MTEDVQGRIRELTRRKRFWKRCALGATGLLVLALATFTSLSLVLYTSLMTEKERLTQQLQDLRKTASDGLQQGKDLLRNLNIDGRKLEQQVRQFLRRDPASVQAPVPPRPAVPAKKEGGQKPAALLPPTPVAKEGRPLPAAPLPAVPDQDCRKPPEAPSVPVPPPDQDLNRALEQGLRRGREFLRGLKVDRGKVEQQVRQLLQPDPSGDQPPALPPAPIPVEKQ